MHFLSITYFDVTNILLSDKMDYIENYVSKYPTFDRDAVKFKHPCSILVSGPSQCGKSTLINKMVGRIAEIMTVEPKRTIWVYGGNSVPPSLDRLETMSYNADKITEVVNENPRQEPRLIILDDLQSELSSTPGLSTLFTRDVHHNNTSVIFICQNLYFKGSSAIEGGKTLFDRFLEKLSLGRKVSHG